MSLFKKKNFDNEQPVTQIEFEERYDSNDGFTRFYFKAPKEMLTKDYPEALSAEISIEVPTKNIMVDNAVISISPTKYDEVKEGFIDYDWVDISMSVEDTANLLKYGIAASKSRTVETNMGVMPVEDYRDIVAEQNGFDSYNHMRACGYRIGDDEYDTPTTRIFVDMDGTLARFHDEVQYLERMYEENFFKELQPFAEMVACVNELTLREDVEVFILSAAIEGEPPYCRRQKNEWIDRFLPSVDEQHRIYTTAGKPKADFIPYGVSKDDILIDDYNRNLREWVKSGGTSIKCVNNINNKGLGAYGGEKGNLWNGPIINNCHSSEEQYAYIVNFINNNTNRNNNRGR